VGRADRGRARRVPRNTLTRNDPTRGVEHDEAAKNEVGGHVADNGEALVAP